MIIVELLVYGWWDSEAAAFPDEGGTEALRLPSWKQLGSFLVFRVIARFPTVGCFVA